MKEVWKYVALLLYSWLMTGCTSSDTEADAEEKEERVTFMLQLVPSGEDSSPVRAWDEIGADFDSRIEKGTLRMLIFEGKQQVGEVEELRYHAESDASGKISAYYVQGVSSVVLTQGSEYRFLVMANVSSVVGLDTDGPVFEISDLFYPDGHLPLWGMTTHVVDRHPIQYLSPITLMRGVAKVEVKLSEELRRQGYRLSDVELSDASVKGYVFPKLWQETDFTEELTAVEDYFHPYASSGDDSVELQEDESGNYFLYLPEYDNFGVHGAASIDLTIACGDMEETYEEAVEFKNYQSGKAQCGTLHNIVRNHVYTYVVQEVDVGNRMSLKVRRQSHWADCKMKGN